LTEHLTDHLPLTIGSCDQFAQGVCVFRVVLSPRALFALVFLVALLPGVSAHAQMLPVQEQGADAASADPRQVQVQVIAHGVVPMPASEIAWRLSRREAVVPERAALENRAAAFVLADDGVIAIVDDAGSIRARLSPGEATWAESGGRRAIVSLDGNRAVYYEIALVPAAAQTASENAPTTTAFSAPEAEAVDVDLIRDVLERDEEREIAAGLTPLLLVVTGGKVFTETANGEVSEIAAGEFVQVEGGLVVVGASRAPATFVVARVDSSIAERVTLKDLSPVPAATLPPAASPASATPVSALDGPASVAISAFICPAAYRGDDFAADCTIPAEGTTFSIEADGEALLSELTGDGGELTFSGVPPGNYTLLAGVPDEVASSWVSCRNIRGDAFRRASERPRTALSLGHKDHVSCDWYILPARGRDVMRSSLAVSLRACPVGMTAQRFDPEACEPPPGETRLTLRNGGGGERIEATESDPDLWVWRALGAKSYELDVEAQPAGFSESALEKEPCCGEEHDFTVSLPSGFARIERTLFLFPPDVPRNLALTVHLLACPPGMTAETLVAELCQPAPGGATLTLLERGAPVGVTAAAADAWVWNGLGPLDYTLKVNATPPGFTAYQLDDETCCAAEADFALTLDEADTDAQRTLYLFQPLGAESDAGDADADGLNDAREMELGTHPFLPDADEDGLADGDEVNFYGTDPQQPDTDDDDLDDTAEVLTYSTNPLIADTDGDGVSDRREVTAGSDPLDMTSGPATPTPVPTATAIVTVTATPISPTTPLSTPAATPVQEPASLPTLAPEAATVATLTSGSGSRESPEAALDGDGLPTLDEIAIHNTDPLAADIDGDGADDGDEIAARTDPRDRRDR
jgi:hypothetical protein